MLVVTHINMIGIIVMNAKMNLIHDVPGFRNSCFFSICENFHNTCVHGFVVGSTDIT